MRVIFRSFVAWGRGKCFQSDRRMVVYTCCNKETVVTGLKPLLRRQNGNIKDLSPCVFVWGKSMHPILDSIHNTCVDARRRIRVSVSPFNE